MGYLLGVGSSCFLLFHEVTSLHPPSFNWNYFYTCSTHFFSFGAKPRKKISYVVVHTRKGKVPRAIFCWWLSWKHWNTHAYQVSPPYIEWFASLRSEEVGTGISAWGNFLSMVVMETLKYTCVPSFSSMHCMVCKFEKWRSSYREKCLWAFFVDGCHGNNEIHMRTEFHLHVHHSWQVWEVKKWF